MENAFFKPMEEDFDSLNEDFDDLQDTVENLDNSLANNNIRSRGLQEWAESNSLVGYLGELFSGWVGSECKLVINISIAPHYEFSEVHKNTQERLW